MRSDLEALTSLLTGGVEELQSIANLGSSQEIANPNANFSLIAFERREPRIVVTTQLAKNYQQ